MINELALFAGAGGGLLASKMLGWRTVCYVEWNAYAVEVLKARIRDGYLHDAPIWDDCFSFDGKPWAGFVDVISAGFPCQPFSTAGKGLSGDDPLNGWPALKRIIGEVRPRVAWLENVPGLLSKPYIRRIFGDLAEIGYDADWGTLSAAAIGATHKRDRLWIIAYSQEFAQQLQHLTRKSNLQSPWVVYAGFVTDANRQRFQTGGSILPQEWIERHSMSRDIHERIARNSWRFTQPGICGRNDVVAHRVDRLAAIGNGEVPEVARTAWQHLISRILG
jgi:DNA (cytosine-5)-methyltransferase 1